MAEAERDLLSLMLALQAELMETGEFPASLSPLRGTLGGKLPTDPFSGQGYRYRRTETGYRLWSLGPDLVDNGGSVPDRPSDLSMGKPGDLVAGSLYGWPRGVSRRDPTTWPF